MGIIAILLFVFVNSSFVVNEDEVAVVKRFGQITKVVVDGRDQEKLQANFDTEGYKKVSVNFTKGLHFRVPFIEFVQKYTSKYLTYMSTPELINTKDGSRIEIQMYAQYRIVDPFTFNMTVFNKAEANKRMDELVYKTVIQSANTLKFIEFFNETTLQDLLDSKHQELNAALVKQFGLYITDIGINRKSFPESNIQTIEEKMTKQISKESDKLIAEGDAAYVEAQASTDRQKAEIVSKAVEEAAIVKAEADATAIKIYQESLNKDLEFYKFIQRMEIYKNMKGTTVFLDKDSSIFNLLNSGQ